MMLRSIIAAVFVALACPAFAQGCGSTNPNCIVPTRPAGDSTNAAASTEFVTDAVSTGTTGFASLTTQDQTLSGGANVTSLSLSTGSITVDCGKVPLQFITNGGAFTITAPTHDSSCIVKTTNNASAGAISFSGFSVGSNTGDTLDTTNGHKFFISIARINGDSTYSVKALQ